MKSPFTRLGWEILLLLLALGAVFGVVVALVAGGEIIHHSAGGAIGGALGFALVASLFY